MKRHNDIIMRSPRVKIKLKKIILRCELCNKFPFLHCSKPILRLSFSSFSYLFDSVVDLLLGLFPVEEFQRKSTLV